MINLDSWTRRYSALLASHPVLDEAMCWTGISVHMEFDDLVSRLGKVDDVIDAASVDVILDIQTAMYHGDRPDRAVASIVQVPGGMGLLEVNGYAGTNQNLLRALSHGRGVVASIFWNINGYSTLSVGRDGEIQCVGLKWLDAEEFVRAPLLAAGRDSLSRPREDGADASQRRNT